METVLVHVEEEGGAQKEKNNPENKLGCICAESGSAFLDTHGWVNLSPLPCPTEPTEPGMEHIRTELGDSLCHILALVYLAVLGDLHRPGDLPAPSDGFRVLLS
jgi:hypothetical protein